MYSSNSKIKIILTGATGFVGEGILLESLEHPDVEKILMVNRRPYPLTHPKLTECIIPDFNDLDSVSEQITGYDACFYCAGISSVGLDEQAYTRITYDTTLKFATVLCKLNPAMVFNFVSGSHTDSSEQGKVMWARVKGKTENALSKIPFRDQYNFRPGGMTAAPNQKNAGFFYKMIVGIIGLVSPGRVISLKQMAYAMVNTVRSGYIKKTLEMEDIRNLSGIGKIS